MTRRMGPMLSLAVVCFTLQSYFSLAAVLKVPFIDNMMLGRTFDYSKSLVGNDIFSKDAQKSVDSDYNGKFDHKFEMIKSTKDVMDVLDVSGELSLQVMAGVVNVEGKGAYLKSSSENENTVQVLTQTYFRTYVDRFKDEVKPIKIDWKNEKIIGQHYIDSITYGGYLIASLKFTAKKSSEKEKIEASIKGEIKAAKVEASLEGLFNKLISKTKDSTELSISYSSTIIPDMIPVNYTTLLDNIRNFRKEVEGTQGGKGVPIQVSLRELKYLDEGIPEFQITPELQEEMREFATYYHDLKTTSDEVGKTLENTPLSAEQENKFGEFNANIWNMMEVFFNTIDNLDLNEKGGKKVDQLKKAKTAYGNLPGKYMRAFKQLIRRYPMYESDENKIPLDLGKMKLILKVQNDKFSSVRSLTSGRQVAVSFLEKDAGNYMIAPGKATDMNKVMACFSAKSNDGKHQTFLSYATLDHPNEFVIATNGGKLIVTRRNIESKFDSDFEMNSGTWHAWCFCWSDAGNIEVYKDGEKQQESKNGVASGTKIEKGGVWMVGQAQLKGKPDGQEKSFEGEITNVNIFEESDEAFGTQASKSTCYEPESYTNIVRPWKEFRRGKVGDIKALKENTACSGNRNFNDFQVMKGRGRYLHQRSI